MLYGWKALSCLLESRITNCFSLETPAWVGRLIVVGHQPHSWWHGDQVVCSKNSALRGSYVIKVRLYKLVSIVDLPCGSKQYKSIAHQKSSASAAFNPCRPSKQVIFASTRLSFGWSEPGNRDTWRSFWVIWEDRSTSCSSVELMCARMRFWGLWWELPIPLWYICFRRLKML